MNEETEELDDGLVSIVGDVNRLTNGKVSIMEDPDTYKSTYQILKEISEVWNELTDKQRAQLLEKLFAKRQGNIGAAIISNFSQAEKAILTMSDSAGNAMQEMDIIEQSLEYKLNALKETGTGIYQNLFQREEMGAVIEFFTWFLDKIDFLTEHLGLFGTTLAGIGIASFFKNIFSTIKAAGGGIKGFGDILAGAQLAFPNATRAASNFFGTLNSGQGIVAAARSGISGLWGVIKAHPFIFTAAALSALIMGISSLVKKAEEARKEQIQIGDSAKEEVKSITDLYNTYKTAQEAYSLNTGSKESLDSATEALLESLGYEKTAIQDLIVEYGDLDTAINKITVSALEDNLLKIRNGYDALKEEIVNVTTKKYFLKGINASSDSFANIRLSAIDALNATKYDSSGLHGDALVLDLLKKNFTELNSNNDVYNYGFKIGGIEKDALGFWEPTYKNIKNAYEELVKYKKALVEASHDYKSGLTQTDLDNSKLFSQINERIAFFEEYFKQDSDFTEKINQSVASIQIESFLENNKVPKTIEQYKELKNAVLENGKANEQFVGTEEEINNSITNVLASMPQLAKFAEQEQKTLETTQRLSSLFQGKRENNRDYDEFQRWINSLSYEDLEVLYNVSLNTEAAEYSLKEWKNALKENSKDYKAIHFNLNIDTETEGLKDLNTALKESASSTGLTSESVEKLNSRYESLKGHESALTKLFEKSSAGIRLNAEAARELEKAYIDQNKTGIQKKLQVLKDKYNDLTLEMDNCADAGKRATLYEKRDNILEQIKDTAVLASQYEALTSSYNEWQEASKATDQRDMYQNIAKGYDDIKKLIDQGWYNDSEVNSYLDLLLNVGQRTKDNVADFKKLSKDIEGTSFSIADFFKVGKDGELTTDHLFDFFDVVKQKLGEEYVQITDSGYAWDFTGDKIKHVADALGMSTEAVEILEKAMGDITPNLNLDSFVASLDGLMMGMSDRVENLKIALGEKAEGYTLDFNFGSFDKSDLNRQIENIKSVIDENFRNDDGQINLYLEGSEEAVSILASLIARKQELEHPVIMSVDTSNLEGETGETIGLLQELQNNLDSVAIGKEIGLDTSDAQKRIQEIVISLNTLDDDKKAKLGLDTEEFQSAINTITSDGVKVDGKIQIPESARTTLQTALNNISEGMMIEVGVNAENIKGFNPEDKTSKVTYLLDSKEVDEYNPKDHERSVTYTLIKTPDLQNFNPKNLDRTVTYAVKTRGSVPYSPSGTTRAQGTAFASGYWGTRDSGVALGGEVGKELVVRDGRFFTIGDNGAEFFSYKHGDIIFNAEQTRQIFANGRITNGKKRGVAYASGTPYSPPYSTNSGSNAKKRTTSSSSSSSKKSSSSKSSSKSSSSKSSSSKSTSSSSSKDLETIDWIEVAIERIEQVIKRLSNAAKSTYNALKTRLGATADQITKVNEELSLQQKAYDRYMKQANSVGLSSDLAAKVRDGTVDISKYNDKTAELIKQYQEWYLNMPLYTVMYIENFT